MRNFSMKKFGTPTRAAPGSASENVGLLGVGAPPVVVCGGVFGFGVRACGVVRQIGAGRIGLAWPPTVFSRAARIAIGLRLAFALAVGAGAVTQWVGGR